MVNIDITGNCNQRCEFCYQTLDGSSLPTDVILDVVQEQKSDSSVQVGGGEPMLDPRILWLIEKFVDMGKRVHIATNGTVIPEGLLDLEETVKKNVEIQVSLHASSPELYKSITGTDFFDRVLENIGALKAHFTTLITSVVYQRNYGDMQNIIDLAEQMGLPLRVNLVFPVGLGKDVIRLTSKQVEGLRGLLLAERLGKKGMIDSPLVHAESNCHALEVAYGIPRTGQCPFDLGKLYVAPSGERFGCEFYRKKERRNEK